MRFLIIAAFLCLAACLPDLACAQKGSLDNRYVVTGIAEAEYEPDYIIVGITHRESQKADRQEVNIARKERALMEVLKRYGIDTALLTVHRFSSMSYNSFIYAIR